MRNSFPDTCTFLETSQNPRGSRLVARRLGFRKRAFLPHPTHHSARANLERGREDDTVLSAEKALLDTKEQIKALQRQARQVVMLAEQHELQEKIQEFEQGGYLQGRECDHRKRGQFIDSLERRLAQWTEAKTLFTIRRAVP